MAFRVAFSELAADKFLGLDKPVRERIAPELKAVAEDPARYLRRLSSVDAYKLPVGAHRATVDVDWEGEAIYVLTVGHRSTVYR